MNGHELPMTILKLASEGTAENPKECQSKSDTVEPIDHI
jgi:hypothetical protein